MARDDRKDGRRRPAGVSRRDFLRGGAAGALGAGILSGGLVGEACAAEDSAAGPDGLVGPGPVPMRFRINGRTFEAELEPRVTLLDALRERFGLTGSKRVCDRGTCGSCTVTLNGRTAYACSVLAIEAASWDEQRVEVETVEALGTPEDLYPLQAAYVEHDAQQCGFCTPGFVVSCAALLAENPSPTPEDVDHGLAGNFCRCGTYAGIREVMEGGGRHG